MALVGEWKLNEQSGIIVNDSAGSNNGTWSGAELVTNGAMTDLTGWTQTDLDYVWNSGSLRCDYAAIGFPEDRILSQDVSGVSSKTYDVSVNIVIQVTGTLSISLGLGSTPTVISGVAVHTFSAVWGGSDSIFYIEGSVSGDIAFKDVSVMEVLIPVTSPVGSGFVFDGVSDYVDIGNAALSAKTVALWIKQPDIAGNEYPIDLNGTDFLSIESGVVTVNGFTAPLLYVNGNLATSGVTTIEADKWYFIAITDTTAATTSDLDIGRETANQFQGSISGVGIYDAVLTVSDIGILWNNGASKGLRGRYAPASPGRVGTRGRERY